MKTSLSYSMHFSKQVALPCGIKLWSDCWLMKEGLASNTHKLYATAVETWAKQCTKTCKTLTYSNFEAFDFTFDVHLYYIHIYFYVPWFIILFIHISNQYRIAVKNTLIVG